LAPATPYLGHIYIDDGIIADIGANIQVPFDAQVIDADTAHVYAGFIATLSHLGLKPPSNDQERPQVKRSGYPPNDVAGITPEKNIADLFKPDDSSITNMRKQGFTIAHSVPHGRMLPGQGSIVTLNGKSYPESVILKDMSLLAQWKTAPRVFPATLIGIMAKWRELYKNAQLGLDHTKGYKSNPASKKRPNIDAATEAMFSAVDKSKAVYFVAEHHKDVARTVQLQKDLGFDLVLAEVKDINRIIDRLDNKAKSNAQGKKKRDHHSIC